MLAPERLLEIEEKFGTKVDRIVPVEFDEETLRVILYLKDGTNLRVTEQWSLFHTTNIWGQRRNLQPSGETSLDEVMGAILKMK